MHRLSSSRASGRIVFPRALLSPRPHSLSTARSPPSLIASSRKRQLPRLLIHWPVCWKGLGRPQRRPRDLASSGGSEVSRKLHLNSRPKRTGCLTVLFSVIPLFLCVGILASETSLKIEPARRHKHNNGDSATCALKAHTLWGGVCVICVGCRRVRLHKIGV